MNICGQWYPLYVITILSPFTLSPSLTGCNQNFNKEMRWDKIKTW